MPLSAPTLSSYLTLDARLKTFAKSKSKAWPHPSSYRATPDTLSKAGFAFTPDNARKSDRVTCFVCGKTLGGWEPEDDPFTEHVTHSPSCSWALARCSIEALRVSIDSTELVFPNETSMPANPMLEAARLATFGKFWPHDSVRSHSAKSKHMAKAGFIYTPTTDSDDLASCFYCNLGLDGWESTDDPYHEHQRRRPHCAFFTAQPSLRSEPEPEPETESEPQPKPRKGKAATRKAQSSDHDAEEESAPTRNKKSANPSSTTIKRTASKSSQLAKPALSATEDTVKSEPADNNPSEPSVKTKSKATKAKAKPVPEPDPEPESEPEDDQEEHVPTPVMTKSKAKAKPKAKATKSKTKKAPSKKAAQEIPSESAAEAELESAVEPEPESAVEDTESAVEPEPAPKPEAKKTRTKKATTGEKKPTKGKKGKARKEEAQSQAESQAEPESQLESQSEMEIDELPAGQTPRQAAPSRPVIDDSTPKAGVKVTSGLPIPTRSTPSPTRLPVPGTGGGSRAGTPRADGLGTANTPTTGAAFKPFSSTLGTPTAAGTPKPSSGSGIPRIGGPAETSTPRLAGRQASPTRPVFGSAGRPPPSRPVFGVANTNTGANANAVDTNTDTIMAGPPQLTALASPTRSLIARSPGLANIRSPGLERVESTVPFPRDSSPMTPSGPKTKPILATIPKAALAPPDSTSTSGPPVDMSLAELDEATRALTLEAYVRREMGTQYDALKAECEREIEEFLKAARETRSKIAAL